MIAYTEFVDFLAKGTSPQEIIDYRPSSEVQDRVSYLLEQNRAQLLNEAEASELVHYMMMEHLMRMAKAKARTQVG